MSTDRYRTIDEIASDWLARRDSGEWTDEDRHRFDQWLNESALHRVAYLRIEHVWERSERLRVLGAGTGCGAVPPPPNPRRRRFARHLTLATAATILLAVTLSTAYRLWPSGTSYRTPIGGLAVVPITDGSKVTLNTDSEIRVAVTEKERRIELEQGEAFFEVAKDPARPFVVRAGNKRVVAVGTKFSVRRDANDIQIIVTEGKVSVEAEGGSGSGSAEPLTAGTIAQANDAGVLRQTSQLAEAEEHLSWRQGILVFRQMTLADASAEFNRYNIRKIVIEAPGVAELRIAGNFRANNVEAFVQLLERAYPLRAEERGDQFVLTAR